MARSGGDPRRYPRQGEGNEILFAEYAVVNGNRSADAHILNFSRHGMAVEFPGPAPVFAEARLYIDGFASPVLGVIRHCTTRGTAYVLGMEVPGEWNQAFLQERLQKLTTPGSRGS